METTTQITPTTTPEAAADIEFARQHGARLIPIPTPETQTDPTTTPEAAEPHVCRLFMYSGPAGLGQRIADILEAFYTDDTPTAASQPLDLAGEHLALALIDSSRESAAEPYARFALQIGRRELARDIHPEVRRRRARRALRIARRELATGALASCAETNVLDDVPQGRLTVSGDVYLIHLLAEAASGRDMTIEENVRIETAVPA